MIRHLILTTLFVSSALADSEGSLSTEQLVVESLNEPNAITFTPPEGWQFADPKALPKHVKVMAVGKGKKEFPPSINLGFDPYEGSLKTYLKVIKNLNKSEGVETKDLGKIKTAAGAAALLQVDSKTKWGEERQLQAIYMHNGKAWILTCSALKKEFPAYYKIFFDAIKSISLNNAS